MTYQCLVLTPWMTPHDIFEWHESVSGSLSKPPKLNVLEEYEETVSSPSVVVRIPAVARLVKPLSKQKSDVKFSRINVYTRDGFRCQYCGERKLPRELTYDHVVPRARGGKTVWENIVTACVPCNTRKDARTPEQAGMRLAKRPTRPTSLPMSATLFVLPATVPDLWLPYLSGAAASRAG